jgi:signal transduction histidine kinase
VQPPLSTDGGGFNCEITLIDRIDIKKGEIFLMANEKSNMFSFIKNTSEDIRIEVYYRYISLLITSLFYLLGSNEQGLGKKVFFVICITLSSFVLTYLYIINDDSPRNIKLLVLLETVGNSFILIPSGGLSSPYIWYALNTILISSLKLNKINCWINLVIYICCSTGIAYYVLGEKEMPLFEFVGAESRLMISFVLITAAVQLLNGALERIKHERKIVEIKNKQLIESNKMVNKSMECVMAFYQAVHSFSNSKDNDELIRMLVHYTKKTSTLSFAFFCKSSAFENIKIDDLIIESKGETSESFKKELSKLIAEEWRSKTGVDGIVVISLDNRRFVSIAVNSIHMEYGVLGIEVANYIEESKTKTEYAQLKFMGELGSIVFEKSYMEEINEGLLINEEQNRIANEIHDSVLQRLFGMSSGMFVLIRKMENMPTNEIRRELNVVRNSIDGAMKELRRTIYNISWEKSGRNAFEENLENYIKEIKDLNNVDITYEISGKYEIMPYRYKKVIYRIVSEVVSNALHHGKANHIKIVLDIKAEIISLEIADDGIGFDFDEVKRRGHMGLGIKNICYLAESLNGRTMIDSKVGKGTTIRTKIPNGFQPMKEGRAI